MRSACFSFAALALSLATVAASGQVNPHTQIRWPANCNTAGMAYDFSTNTCVPTTGFSWRGAWQTGTAYNLNDMVTSGSSTYISLVSGNISVPPSASWGTVAQGATSTPGGLHGQVQFNQAGALAGSAATVDAGGTFYSPMNFLLGPGTVLPPGLTTGVFVAQRGYAFGGWSTTDQTLQPVIMDSTYGVNGQVVNVHSIGDGSASVIVYPCDPNSPPGVDSPFCAQSLTKLMTQIILHNKPGPKYQRFGITWQGDTLHIANSAHNEAGNLNLLFQSGGRIFDGNYCISQGWTGYGPGPFPPAGNVYAPPCVAATTKDVKLLGADRGAGISGGGLIPPQNAAQLSPDGSFMFNGGQFTVPYYGTKQLWFSLRHGTGDFNNSGNVAHIVSSRTNLNQKLAKITAISGDRKTFTVDTPSSFAVNDLVWPMNTLWSVSGPGSASTVGLPTTGVPLQVASISGSDITMTAAFAAMPYGFPTYTAPSGYLVHVANPLTVTAATQTTNSALTVSGYDATTVFYTGLPTCLFTPADPTPNKDWNFCTTQVTVDATHITMQNTGVPAAAYPGGGYIYRKDSLGTYGSLAEDTASTIYAAGLLQLWQIGTNICGNNAMDFGLQNQFNGHCLLQGNQKDQLIGRFGFSGTGTSASGNGHFIMGVFDPNDPATNGSGGKAVITRGAWGLSGLEGTPGSNTGSDINLWWYQDSGAFGGTVMKYHRDLGRLTLSAPTEVTSAFYLPSAPSGSGNGAPLCVDPSTTPANQVKKCQASAISGFIGSSSTPCTFPTPTNNPSGGTSETNIYNCQIPSGTMGANARLKIHVGVTGIATNTGTCTLTLRWSNASGTITGGNNFVLTNGGTGNTSRFITEALIQNAASTSSQNFDYYRINNSTNGVGMGSMAGSFNTTTTNTYVVFNLTNSVGTDTCTVQDANVELWPNG